MKRILPLALALSTGGSYAMDCVQPAKDQMNFISEQRKIHVNQGRGPLAYHLVADTPLGYQVVGYTPIAYDLLAYNILGYQKIADTPIAYDLFAKTSIGYQTVAELSKLYTQVSSGEIGYEKIDSTGGKDSDPLAYDSISDGTIFYDVILDKNLAYDLVAYTDLGYEAIGKTPVAYQTIAYTSIGYDAVAYTSIGYQRIADTPIGYEVMGYTNLGYELVSGVPLGYHISGDPLPYELFKKDAEVSVSGVPYSALGFAEQLVEAKSIVKECARSLTVELKRSLAEHVDTGACTFDSDLVSASKDLLTNVTQTQVFSDGKNFAVKKSDINSEFKILKEGCSQEDQSLLKDTLVMTMAFEELEKAN